MLRVQLLHSPLLLPSLLMLLKLDLTTTKTLRTMMGERIKRIIIIIMDDMIIITIIEAMEKAIIKESTPTTTTEITTMTIRRTSTI